MDASQIFTKVQEFYILHPEQKPLLYTPILLIKLFLSHIPPNISQITLNISLLAALLSAQIDEDEMESYIPIILDLIPQTHEKEDEPEEDKNFGNVFGHLLTTLARIIENTPRSGIMKFVKGDGVHKRNASDFSALVHMLAPALSKSSDVIGNLSLQYLEASEKVRIYKMTPKELREEKTKLQEELTNLKRYNQVIDLLEAPHFTISSPSSSSQTESKKKKKKKNKKKDPPTTDDPTNPPSSSPPPPSLSLNSSASSSSPPVKDPSNAKIVEMVIIKDLEKLQDIDQLEKAMRQKLGELEVRRNEIKKREEEKLREQRLCPICLDGEKNTSLTPCGHVFCKGCAKRFRDQGSNKCPFCRTNIMGLVAIYYHN